MKKLSKLVLTTSALLLFSCGPSQPSENSNVDSSPAVSEETYRQIVINNVEGCKITCPSEALVGSTVTLQLDLNEGYGYNSFLLNGKKMYGNTFVMPDYDVLIKPILDVLDITRVFKIKTLNTSNGSINLQNDSAHPGEVITCYFEADEGFSLSEVYANDILMNFYRVKGRNNQYFTNVAMTNRDLEIKAVFEESKTSFEEYNLVLSSGNYSGAALSYWKVSYLDEGIKFDIAVEDPTYTDSGKLHVWTRDNIEFKICPSSKSNDLEEAKAIRLGVACNGTYHIQRCKSDGEYYDYGEGMNYVYGRDLIVSGEQMYHEFNDFDGYYVSAYLGYSIFGLTKEEAVGNMTFSPAIKDNTGYNYRTNNFNTYWSNCEVTMSKRNLNVFLNDEFKCSWNNPSCFIGISEDGSLFSRFESSHKDVDYLFFGDDFVNTDNWGNLYYDFKDENVFSFAFNGLDIESVLDNDDIYRYIGNISPKNIILSIGENDIVNDSSIDEVKDSICSFVEDIHDRCGANIYFLCPVVKSKTSLYEDLLIELSLEIEDYSETAQYLEVLNVSDDDLFFDGDNILFYTSNGSNLNDAGYNVVLAKLCQSLGFSSKSKVGNYGDNNRLYSSSGWTSENNVLSQLNNSATCSLNYLYFNDEFNGDFEVSADFTLLHPENNASYPKLGFIISDGFNEVRFHIITSSTLNYKALGMTSRIDGKTDNTKNSYYLYNPYFTNGDFANLKISKDGDMLSLYLGSLVLGSVDVSAFETYNVGFFTQNATIQVKNVEVK